MFRTLVAFCVCTAWFFISSCEPEKQSSDGNPEGVRKQYFPDGTLFLEVSYKDNLPDGLTKRYNSGGQLVEEAQYKQGVLHGITKKYQENGSLLYIIPYDSGRVHGFKKKYRTDGTPAYEAPYHYDRPCKGLIELFLSGRPVDNYPSINIIPTGKANTIELSLSNGSERVEFYKGDLIEGKYIGDDAYLITTRNEKGKLVYDFSDDALTRKRLSFIAKVKTDLGNYFITDTTYVPPSRN